MAKKRNDGGPAALSSLRLRNFKGFESFDLNFRPFTLLVGPNNAGKSTLLSAIRAGASMLALASRRNATANEDFRGETVRVHYLGSAPGGLETENLRHEFQDDVETSLEFVFGGQSRLRAVWPEQDSGRSPFSSSEWVG